MFVTYLMSSLPNTLSMYKNLENISSYVVNIYCEIVYNRLLVKSVATNK
jgi:hypothetical protein